MILQFVGADHQVTGSAHYVEACGRRFLVDYGMEQGGIKYVSKGLPCDEADLDFVLLTHAHVDHSGMLPLLYKHGFRGPIYTTPATKDLAGIMLRDCAHIQVQEAEWKARKKKRADSIENDAEPIYNLEDAEGAIKLLTPIKYGTAFEPSEGIKIRFTDVGHLLGSASIEIFLSEAGVHKKIVFSGDIGNKDQPLIKDPIYTDSADYVVMESTYGNRYHEKAKVNSLEDLANIIESTLEGGGNLVIPSFAVGRTQEILFFIKQIKEKKLVKNVNFPVYMDSPLAVDATEIFRNNTVECFDEEALEVLKNGGNPLEFNNLNFAITSEESKAINFDNEPKVIISASGMCEAGRIRHHLKHNLWRPECTILFVGYQAEGTLGRILTDGTATEVKLFGEPISVRAKIAQLPGLSGHADKAGLTEWIQAFKEKPAKVFVVHGDDDACEAFKDYLNNELQIPAYAPFSGTVFDLKTGEIVHEEKPEAKKKSIIITGIFKQLIAAGERLMLVIRKNEGHANSDIIKFTGEVNALSDKWDPDMAAVTKKPAKRRKKK